jgi:hypothetical protein
MKRIILFLIGLLFLPIDIFSQDIILLKTGEEIKAKVEEIDKTVKYKKFENLSGPSYLINVELIFMIKYENGTKDIFNDQNTLSNKSEKTDNTSGIFEYKEFSNISLNKIFSEGKLVMGIGALYSSSISYNGNYIGMYFVDALIKEYKYMLLKVDEKGLTFTELKGKTNPVENFNNSIGFSSDSKQFYALTTNMELYIWSTESGELLTKLSGKGKGDINSAFIFLNSGTFSYDSETNMVHSDGFLYFGDYLYIFNGNVTEPFASCATKTKIKGIPSRVAFSKDNQLMAFASTLSKNANLYNLKTGQLIGSVNSCEKSINAMLFSANNRNLIISEKFSMCSANIGSSTTNNLFSLDKYSYDMDVNCHNILAYSIIPSNATRLWDLNKNKLLFDIPEPFKSTYKLLFSYDGNRLYAISARGEIVCWGIDYN